MTNLGRLELYNGLLLATDFVVWVASILVKWVLRVWLLLSGGILHCFT